MFKRLSHIWLKNAKQAVLPVGIIALVVLPYAQAGNVTATPMFNEAVQAYNGRRYAEALKKFNSLVQSGQNTDMVHYYMALCYQGQNQISMAKAEYSLVSAQSHDPALRGNAQRALASIDRWSAHRSYEGNGNVFQRYSRPSARSLSGTIAARIREGSGITVPTRAQDPDCPPSG